MADQFRADAVGCVGRYSRTPNLDRIARRGWLFDNAYANSAECIPSRLSLATGLYPHQTGVDRNIGCTLNPDFPNWMRAIEAAGYRTSLFGKTHLHPHSGDLRDRVPLMNQYGLQVVDETGGPRALAHLKCNLTDLWREKGMWDEYRTDFSDRFARLPFLVRPSPLPLELYYDCYVGRVARDYLQSLDAAGGPWFCWVSFGGPHEPWDAPEPYASMYAPQSMPDPRPRRSGPKSLRGLLKEAYASPDHSPAGLTTADIAAMRANYAGNVTLIDDQIGELLKVVEDRNEMDRTLIVFTSDHGEMNGDEGLIYKANSLDPTIKIPLIVVPPGGDRSTGTTSKAMVELMDIGATMIDYAQARPPAPSRARSLRPLMRGDAGDHRPFCISEFGGHTCVVTPACKVEFDSKFEATLAFDRVADPDESDDISCNATMSASIEEIRAELRSFLSTTPASAGAWLQ